MRSNSLAFIVVLAAALLLRVLRLHVRWDEITLAYAAYAEPLAAALEGGQSSTLLSRWIGLHPPLWGGIQALFEVIAPIPWVWMGFSVLCSLAAVWVVGRHAGWIAALVLATAPTHLWDAAEVNNYPLASLAIALMVVAASGPWAGLAAAAVVAVWSHLLAFVPACALVLWRAGQLRPSDRNKLLVTFGLGALPIVGGVARLMEEGSTWAQPEVVLVAWVDLVGTTMGAEGLMLAPLVLWGLRGASGLTWAAMGLALIAAVGLGAAAAHQRPYLGLFAPLAALAVAHACRRGRRLIWVVVLLCTTRGLRFAVDDFDRFRAIVRDVSSLRGVDVALQSAAVGDAVWLVSPALQPDDDKTASSSVLWRMRPWRSLPIARPVSFEYTDYRFGQPRVADGVQVHTSTELYDGPFDHIARDRLKQGAKLVVVLYDHGPATGINERLERVLQPYVVTWREVGEDRGLGRDRVAFVTGIK